MSDSEQRTQLRVVNGGQSSTAPKTLEADVRDVRRDVARLLRALQAAGHSITRWRSDVITRLAHFDSVTARHVIDRRGDDVEIEAAVRGLRAIEAWMVCGLSRAQLAEVRTFELLIRIETHELHEPLLRPHAAPEDHSQGSAEWAPQVLRSLRAGLRSLEEPELFALGRRLGVAPFKNLDTDTRRTRVTQSIVRTLRDDQLLAILITTLDPSAQKVLLELVLGEIDEVQLKALDKPAPLALVVGGAPIPERNPVDHLRACGLVFGSTMEPGKAWVPVELQPRISGVLIALGL